MQLVVTSAANLPLIIAMLRSATASAAVDGLCGLVADGVSGSMHVTIKKWIELTVA